MPFIKISLRAGKPAAYRQAIMDSLYRAMRCAQADRYFLASHRDGNLSGDRDTIESLYGEVRHGCSTNDYATLP